MPPCPALRLLPLLSWLALPALLAAHGPALAQPEETVTVTGARAGAAAATSVLDSARIDASGATTLGALLGQLPVTGGQGINDAQDDNGHGEAFVDLRSLNFNRTLVLVDGSRFVLSGIQTDEAVDLNTIPAAFVDRIEVHADGSAPRLGADAVAGTVDVILRHEVDGVRLDAYGGAAGAGDDRTAGLSLVAGRAIEGGHLTIGLDVLQRTPILQNDRAWAAHPITGTLDGRPLVGSIATPGGHVLGTDAAGGGIDALALGGGRFAPFDPATDQYDFAGARDLQGGLRRASVMVDAARAIGAVTAHVNLLFTDRSATTLLPPQTLGLAGTDKHPDGFVVPASDPFNPFGVPVTLARVVGEAGPQQTTTSGPVWRLTAGLQGAVAGWDWSASVDRGESLSRYATGNEIDLSRALQTVGGGCGGAPGCVAADWFGPGSLSPAALAYVRYTSVSRARYAETAAVGRVSRDLLALPGGPARLTLGGELRGESGSTSVDAVTRAGDQAGEDAAPTGGSYSTQEATASLDLPLARQQPFAELADVRIDARETRTSRYGSFPTLRGALRYAPASWVSLQAVAGTARRVPAIAEAFGGVTGLPLPVTDPCDAARGLRANPVVDGNCRAAGLGPGFAQASPVIDVASGGNPALRPERSENATLGITLRPPAWPFLTMSLDWWRYRITDAIDSLADTDPDLIADSCYASPDRSSPLCGLVTRVPGGGSAGQISRILGLDENVGTIRTDGIDAQVTLDRAVGGLGRLSVQSQATWLLDWRIRTLGQSAFTQYAGTFPGLNGVGSYARLRSRTTASLARGAWEIGWTGRSISGATVTDTGMRAPSVLYQDIEASRTIGRVTLAAGVQNLAGVRPPLLLDGETNTDTATYDVVGRFVWLRLSCTL